MSQSEIDPTTPAMGTRAHVVACIPLLMLSAIAAWILLARPTAQTTPPPDHVALHIAPH